jgi:hypothetical protein
MGALDTKPFGINSADGSMGDDGIANKESTRYETDGGQDEKFELQKANPNCSAAQAQYSGRQ